MARTGQIRGRRGIIGGYWGGYSLLSLSPTPRALPGKVENLTPPAAGQKRTGWSTASADRATLERCQLEPLRPDQCQRQQPGTGTGSRPPPPTICTGMHPAQQIAPPVQTEGQSSSAHRNPAACLPQRISTIHDRQTAQNQPTAARCRRGQILYLTGISTLQYSRKLG